MLEVSAFKTEPKAGGYSSFKRTKPLRLLNLRPGYSRPISLPHKPAREVGVPHRTPPVGPHADRMGRASRSPRPEAYARSAFLRSCRDELAEAVWVASIVGALMVASIGLGAIIVMALE